MNDLLTMAQTEGLLDMLLLPFKDAPQSNPRNKSKKEEKKQKNATSTVPLT